MIGVSLSEPHTGGSRFNRGTVVTFTKVYATNTESPTLVVVDSTVVRWSRFRNNTEGPTLAVVYVSSTEGLASHVACS